MLEMWLPPLLLAMFLTPIALYVAYYVIVPRVITAGYAKQIPSTRFQGIDGSEGAGSIDIVYFNLYFDVRNEDVVIHGSAPAARHWQIGAFDGFARLIDGAYLNHKTVTLDENGDFYVRLTKRPLFDETENVLDCSKSPRGMVIFRIVLPQQSVTAPAILQRRFAPPKRQAT